MGKGSRKNTRTKRNKRTNNQPTVATELPSYLQDKEDKTETPVVVDAEEEADTMIEVKDNAETKENLRIRVLYGCPVCILTTPKTEAHPYPNAMTLSWLCPVSNQGLFAFSIAQKRHTAQRLQMEGKGAQFVLSVPVQGMEKMVLGIGSCTGGNGDKLKMLKVPLCGPGWTALPGQRVPLAEGNQGNPFAGLEDEEEEEEEVEEEETKEKAPRVKRGAPKGGLMPSAKRGKQEVKVEGLQNVDHLPACEQCVAHIVCHIEEMKDVDGIHWLTTAAIDRVFVRPEYWNGKVFLPQQGSAPFMSFVGSHKFGYVQPPNADPTTEATRETTREAPDETGNGGGVGSTCGAGAGV